MLPKWPAPVWAAICAALVYLPVLGNGYCRDDAALLAATAPTPIVQAEFATLATSHYWAGVEPDGNLYRPLTTLSLAAEELFVPGSAAAHHFGNLLWHALAAALGALLLAAIGFEGPWLLIAAIWLAVHPLRSDAVCEAVQRSELLAFSGLCGALLCEAKRRAGGGPAWLAGLGACAFAALLSKESAVAVVALLPLFAWLRPERFNQGGWRAGGPAFAVLAGATALYFVLRTAVLGGLGTGLEVHDIDNPYAALGFLGRLPGACASAATYAALVVWPWGLAADYSFSVFDPAAGWTAGAFAGLAVMAATAVALWPGPRQPWRVMGAAWIAVTLGPFINLLFPMGYVVAERALYAPLFGGAVWLAAAGVSLSERWPERARWILIGAATVVALLGLRTTLRTLAWKSDAVLYASNIQVQPRASRGWFAHGVERRKAGDGAGAEAAFTRAVELNSRYPEALSSLGDLAREAGRADEALRWYRRALGVARPGDPRQHGTLGAFLASQGRYEEALPHLREAARRAPGAPAVWHNLVQALALMRRTAEARGVAEEAMRLHPDDSTLRGMHEALLRGAPPPDALTPPDGRR